MPKGTQLQPPDGIRGNCKSLIGGQDVQGRKCNYRIKVREADGWGCNCILAFCGREKLCHYPAYPLCHGRPCVSSSNTAYLIIWPLLLLSMDAERLRHAGYASFRIVHGGGVVSAVRYIMVYRIAFGSSSNAAAPSGGQFVENGAVIKVGARLHFSALLHATDETAVSRRRLHGMEYILNLCVDVQDMGEAGIAARLRGQLLFPFIV